MQQAPAKGMVQLLVYNLSIVPERYWGLRAAWSDNNKPIP